MKYRDSYFEEFLAGHEPAQKVKKYTVAYYGRLLAGYEQAMKIQKYGDA